LVTHRLGTAVVSFYIFDVVYASKRSLYLLCLCIYVSNAQCKLGQCTITRWISIDGSWDNLIGWRGLAHTYFTPHRGGSLNFSLYMQVGVWKFGVFGSKYFFRLYINIHYIFYINLCLKVIHGNANLQTKDLLQPVSSLWKTSEYNILRKFTI